MSYSEALRHLKNNQDQLDPDGCMVGVSRQALDELIDYVEKIQLPLKQLTMCCQEAQRDYAEMADVFEKKGMMSSHREATETSAYLSAMLKRFEDILNESP